MRSAAAGRHPARSRPARGAATAAPRGRSATHAAPPDRESSSETPPKVGLGLKSVWWGAEAFGDILGAVNGGKRASQPRPTRVASDPPLSRAAAIELLKQDYAADYFVSGQGELKAYDSQCEFADPFASFRGVDRFLKNVGNLGTQLDDIRIEQRGWEERADAVVVRWSFSGVLAALPWRPRLAAAGSTTHTFDPASGLVVRHYEDWESSPGAVVKSLLKPSARVPTTPAEKVAASLHDGWGWAPLIGGGAAFNAAFAAAVRALGGGGAGAGPGEWLLWAGVAAALAAAAREAAQRKGE